MKEKKKYIGVVIGGIYGFVYRLLCENNIDNIYEFSVFSLTFVWIIPIIIGVIPVMIAKDEVNTPLKQFMIPQFAVLLFFVFALITQLEDILCILILAIPFNLVAGIAGLLMGAIIKKRNSKNLYSILLLPLLTVPIENKVLNTEQSYLIQNNVSITTTKQLLWDNIVEVNEISNKEYESGFYNLIGIPRPLKAEIIHSKDGVRRIGYFSDELKLTELITSIDTLNHIELEIDLSNSILRNKPTDIHILNGGHFKFGKIRYSLIEINDTTINLNLSCSYKINSKMNWYANFWAKKIISDFEIKLIKVIKKRVETEANK